MIGKKRALMFIFCVTVPVAVQCTKSTNTTGDGKRESESHKAGANSDCGAVLHRETTAIAWLFARNGIHSIKRRMVDPKRPCQNKNAEQIREIDLGNGRFRSLHPWFRSHITDDELAYLVLFKNLRRLVLYSKKITDTGLNHLARLKSLKELSLECPQISNTGLARLSSLQSLEKLTLACPRISDDGLVHLSSLKNLRWLNLLMFRSNHGRGLAALKKLPRLKYLFLSMPVQAKHIAHLAGSQALEELSIYNTVLTEALTVQLAGLPNLKRLTVERISTKKPDLRHLTMLKGLKRLHIADRNQGLRLKDKLKKLLPASDITVRGLLK